ncbi:MAG: hypothetical protein QOE45_3416 [Frankiaceae bacterium]|jgi:hypothetical protein|nr:hypothetical protein [Frankiaceae bacterium]
MCDALDASVLDGAAALASLDDVALGERIVALDVLARRVAAAQAAAVRAFDRRGAADAFGCASTAAWLRSHAGASEREARSLVALSRSLDRWPAFAAAFAEGAVSAAHLRIASAATRILSDETVAAGDAFLTATARALDSGRFAAVVRHWVARVAPSEFERDTERRYDARWLSISETFAGMRSIQGMLDPESGALIESAVASLLAANPVDDARTRDQQRADALTDLVQVAVARGPSSLSDAVRPEVVVHAATVAGDVAPPPSVGDQALTPAAFDRLSCDAQWRRLLLDAAAVPVELGRATRTVPAGLRKFVALRDGGCRYPGCARGQSFCEAHHVVHWRHGGRTDADNLVLLCRYHHHVVHERAHALTLLPDGVVEVAKPDGHILTGRPRGPTRERLEV